MKAVPMKGKRLALSMVGNANPNPCARRTPTPIELEIIADPGCEVMTSVGSWAPTHVKSTDLKGILDRPYRLGRWAWDFARQAGRVPTTEEATQHAQGRDVPVPAPI